MPRGRRRRSQTFHTPNARAVSFMGRHLTDRWQVNGNISRASTCGGIPRRMQRALLRHVAVDRRQDPRSFDSKYSSLEVSCRHFSGSLFCMCAEPSGGRSRALRAGRGDGRFPAATARRVVCQVPQLPCPNAISPWNLIPTSLRNGKQPWAIYFLTQPISTYCCAGVRSTEMRYQMLKS
jgi:hypothetical protein